MTLLIQGPSWTCSGIHYALLTTTLFLAAFVGLIMLVPHNDPFHEDKQISKLFGLLSNFWVLIVMLGILAEPTCKGGDCGFRGELVDPSSWVYPNGEFAWQNYTCSLNTSDLGFANWFAIFWFGLIATMGLVKSLRMGGPKLPPQ
mgnify:FL=1